ncbi:MAG: hypothetical protein J6S04_07150 [Clostridia bacterium]|nr:hypothetical protein [Clostridia bacterium]
MEIKENTVSGVNQMINSSELSFLGEANADLKILIVGNSITRHGPKEDIGWSGDWGMAASAPENDYVHRLYRMLKESGRDVYMRIRQCSYWEGNFLKDGILAKYDEERAFDADIVVFRLGENTPTENSPYFQAAMEKFVGHICPSGKTIFTTCWWPLEVIDNAIKAVAEKRGETCLNCTFAQDMKMRAYGLFVHGGVASHPGDYGMEMLAKTIFEEIVKEK